MSNRILIAGIDPGFVNFAVARIMLDLDTVEMQIDDLILFKTENQADKSIRKNSDDLRRAIELRDKFHSAVEGCRIGFAEIPSGAQDHNAAKGFGICIGLLAGSPIPILQVQNFQAKLAAVGTKTASKQEMIEWAMAEYPAAPWKTRMLKGKRVPTNDNEHMADATAIAKAGLGLQEFKQLRAVWLATMAQAAAA